MDYIRVGWIANTHGIKGDIKVQPLTDDIDRFNQLDKVYLGESRIEAKIERVNIQKAFAILKLKDYDSINKVIALKGKYIYIDERDRIELPEGHYFIYDIIDCIVFDVNGNKVGTVIDVIQHSGNDVYIVKDDKNSTEYLIPAVKRFLVDIDIPNKTIIIDPIEGMLE